MWKKNYEKRGKELENLGIKLGGVGNKQNKRVGGNT
jgi:hypothetical protein